MNLQAKVRVFRIRVQLGIKASLSIEVFRVDIESARILIQVEKIALEDTDFVIEHEHAEPNLENQGEIRVDFTLDLRRKLASSFAREAMQCFEVSFPLRAAFNVPRKRRCRQESRGSNRMAKFLDFE